MILDVELDSWNIEYGAGQVEVPLKPYCGMDGLDKIWLFRQLSKHVAYDMGLIACYMTVPIVNAVASGMHINHSLWRDSENGLKNAMWNPSGDGKLSEVSDT